MLGTVCGSVAWVVVRRAPLPRWLQVGAPALLYGVAAQSPDSAALYALTCAALIAFGAALGAFVRPGDPADPGGPEEPSAPRSGVAAVAAFAVTSAIAAAAAAAGLRGSGPESTGFAAAILWGLTATAGLASVRPGRTARVTRADIADVALLIALVIAVNVAFRFQAPRALPAAMVLHTGVQWWMSRQTPRFGPYAGLAALCMLGPAAVSIGDRELPAALVELRAAATGIRLPAGEQASGYVCPPTTALSGPIPCGMHLVAVVSRDTPLAALDGANAFVSRTDVAWPPSARVTAVSLDLQSGTPITLLGGGRVRYSDGSEGALPLAPPNHDALEVGYAPDATVGDYVSLCAERPCGVWPPPPAYAGHWQAPIWAPILRFVALMVAGSALIAKAVARAPAPRSILAPLGLALVGLGLAGVELFVFGSAVLLAGVGIGAAATAPMDGRRGRVTLGLACALGLAAFAIVGWRSHDALAVVVCAWGIGPIAVAGRRGLERQRAELGLAVGAILVYVLVSAYVQNVRDAVFWAGLIAWIAALCVLPAGVAALSARRWPIGALATAASVAIAATAAWPQPDVRRLSAIDAETPLPVVDAPVSGIAPPVCALLPNGAPTDLTTGARCAVPVVAALPAASPAEVVLEHPNIVQFVVRTTHGRAKFGVVVLVEGSAADDPSGAVVLRPTDTLGSLLARCETRCLWFRSGVATVP